MNLLQYITNYPDKTLADVIAYEHTVDTHQVGSGQARGFFINNDADPEGSFAGNKLWAVFSYIAQDTTHPYFSLGSGIVITASDAQSYLGMDATKADGIANRAGIDALVDGKIMTRAVADAFIAKTLSVSYPFAQVTQPEFDAVKALIAIQKQECAYTAAMSYEVVTATQGLDIDIETDIDCHFVAYLMVCPESKDQNDIANYSPVNGDSPVTTPIKTVNGKATIVLSNRKVRAFNKVFIKPSAVCNFTATTKTNRG